MPTKLNNIGARSGARPSAGRKKSDVKEKAESGNLGGRKLEVLDIPEVEGVDMPKSHDFLSVEQRDGSTLQAEEMANCMGFLSKHPTTQKRILSPFINIGINYMNQAVRLWNEIFQIVKENCSTDYGDASSQENAIVIDAFGGSGSTLMACEQMNRVCCTMELDEGYASVILRRAVENGIDYADIYVERNGETFAYFDLGVQLGGFIMARKNESPQKEAMGKMMRII